MNKLSERVFNEEQWEQLLIADGRGEEVINVNQINCENTFYNHKKNWKQVRQERNLFNSF